MISSLMFGMILDLATIIFVVGMIAFIFAIGREFILGLHEE